MAQQKQGAHCRPSVADKQRGARSYAALFALLAILLVGSLAWAVGHNMSKSSQGSQVAQNPEAAEQATGQDSGQPASQNTVASDGSTSINDTPAGDMPAGTDTTEGDDTNTDTATSPRTQQDSWSISFASTGDMIFGREVGTYVDMYGGAAPLAHVADILAAPDITIGNLEAPLSTNESEGLWEKDVLLISRPEAIEGLVDCDFTFLSLANNHSMDYGSAALSDTISSLDNAGILHAGAGMNYDEAWHVAETTVDGIKIAFISFTDIIPENFLAYEQSAGVAAARIDMDFACDVISNAAASHDIVIVAAHWGIEYDDYANEYEQIEPAHRLVEAGASVVLGNHPHVIQGAEFYQGSLITYSQGDFVFDHYSRETGETFILNFDFTDHGIENVVATPIYLEDPYGIPQVVYGSDAANILERLERISEGMNTTFDLRDDKAFITPTDGNANPHSTPRS